MNMSNRCGSIPVTGRLLWTLQSLAAVLLAGCSGATGTTLPVTGVVRIDNAVWSGGGAIVFDGAKESGLAPLDADGKFRLSLPPGSYRVAIEPPGGIPLERPDPKTSPLPPKYMDPSSSGLTVTISADNRDLTFDLNRR
jgi:hypothetical protein